ncbi:RRQRL motif-containing zinc-binding protein [Streptomyces sp. NPDC101234]|uniref:RRQRL motif-containing zinc-binding protein n=1 Tax=Streptomyces sp. NPDC101234 TaxID=3366138 RepID=UPI003807C5CF
MIRDSPREAPSRPRPGSSARSLSLTRGRLAPEGPAARRRLLAMGLRPGGRDVAIELRRPGRRRGPLVVHLCCVDSARPVRPTTPDRAAALAKANRARRLCPTCRRDVGYVSCRSDDCSATTPAAPGGHSSNRSRG